VPFREPSWWYLPDASPAALLLTPFAHVYGAIVARRMSRPSTYDCPIPVICIGNFTAGGTGKTPLAIFIAEQVKRRGIAPVFLTRGYGSAVRSPTLVDPIRHHSSDVGDEALLLARAAPTMVSPDRVSGARAIAEDGGLNCDLILMDDGLQNPALAKDLRIAVVDGARQFGNGHVIPAGPLRAPLAVQLARSDIVVVNGRRDDRTTVAQAIAPYFRGPVLLAHQSPAGDTGWLNGAKTVAFAGIGNPARFFALLRSLGAQVALERSFPDHHLFSEQDAVQLLADATRLGAELVTTEKDLVRLLGQTGARAELGRRARPLAIATTFADDGEDDLLKRVINVIEKAAAA
jgi:tetraacyldisaccharide 4'-kinase